MTALQKYNAACKAVAAAKSIDEAKDIRDLSAQRPRFPFSKRSATPVYDDHPVAVAAIVWVLVVLAVIGMAVGARAVETVAAIEGAR